MGGSIDVKSELGKGTVFTLILTQKKADENYYRQKGLSGNRQPLLIVLIFSI